MRLAPPPTTRPTARPTATRTLASVAGALARLTGRAATVFAMIFGSLGAAQAGPRQMLPDGQQADWLAVGRLNVTGQGDCTATLIAADLVLTAAHCVVDRRTGRTVDPGRVHFLAGFRAGTYAAHGTGLEVAIVPGFDRVAADVARDLALVRLSAPVDARVKPIPVAPALDPGLPMTIASYGIDRAQILSTETGCGFLDQVGTVIHTTCEGLPGVSGAPVLQTVGGRLAAVAVASAVIAERKVPVARGALLASEATLGRFLLLGRVEGGGAAGAIFAMAGPDAVIPAACAGPAYVTQTP